MFLMNWVRTRFPPDSRLGHLARRFYRQLTPWMQHPLQIFVLEALAQSSANVRFVQIGSNDAGYGDPLRYHILHDGWRGLMVEPLPFVFERLVQRYADIPDMTFANVAIDAQSGSRTFYFLRQDADPALPPWYNQLGSFLKDNVLKHEPYLPDIKQRIQEMEVPCLNFPDLFRKYDMTDCQVLHIDAEGYDYEILSSFDLAVYRPVIVLFEHRHLSDGKHAELLQRLHDVGYLTHADPFDTIAIKGDSLASNPALLKAWRYVRKVAGCQPGEAHSQSDHS